MKSLHPDPGTTRLRDTAVPNKQPLYLDTTKNPPYPPPPQPPTHTHKGLASIGNLVCLIHAGKRPYVDPILRWLIVPFYTNYFSFLIKHRPIK